jgi:hypothetical protein
MNRMTWIAAAVAACAASISPSQAFTDADLDRLAAEILESKTAPGVGDAINDLSSELIECSAITIGAICRPHSGSLFGVAPLTIGVTRASRSAGP